MTVRLQAIWDRFQQCFISSNPVAVMPRQPFIVLEGRNRILHHKSTPNIAEHPYKNESAVKLLTCCVYLF